MTTPILILCILLLVTTIASTSLALSFYNEKISKQKSLDFYKRVGKPVYTEHHDVDDQGKIEIPEEDQEVLYDLMLNQIKHLVYVKKIAPTNAMLIEHLADALASACDSFEPMKGNRYERMNESWLIVSAYALRLYMEGTPHNSDEARESMIIYGKMSSNRLEKWAKHITDQISDAVRKGIIGKNEATNVTEKIHTISNSVYTADEINDILRSKSTRNLN